MLYVSTNFAPSIFRNVSQQLLSILQWYNNVIFSFSQQNICGISNHYCNTLLLLKYRIKHATVNYVFQEVIKAHGGRYLTHAAW